MKKLGLYLIAVVMVGVVAVGMTGCGGDDKQSMTKEEWFGKNMRGMTLEEVIALVGRQPDNDQMMSDGHRYYYWNFSQGTGDVGIREDNRQVGSVGWAPSI